MRHNKDIKVHGFVQHFRRGSPAGQQRRYEVGTLSPKMGFPLDGVCREVCTWSCMTRSTNTHTPSGTPGVLVRLLKRTHLGWRKVATGAGALLALAMGYHVIFGQNGLTAYQQKRQDTQSLDRQLHMLQRENEQLKGHVERLQNDPNAIEHQAREELHYTRPGEVIYTLPATPGSSDTAAQPAPAK
jgi:cell division protein FtsB